jgi:hypothetical protein
MAQTKINKQNNIMNFQEPAHFATLSAAFWPKVSFE